MGSDLHERQNAQNEKVCTRFELKKINILKYCHKSCHILQATLAGSLDEPRTQFEKVRPWTGLLLNYQVCSRDVIVTNW